MNKQMTETRKLGIMAMFVAIGLVLQYIESRFAAANVPGGKLGLANMVSIINIFMLGGGNALIIASIRAVLGCVLTGGISALPYSFFGAFFSTAAMWGAKKWFYPKISIIGISVIGASVHNISQLFTASVIFSSWYVFSYLPGLLIFAVVCGIVTGYAAEMFSKHIFKEILK